MRLRFLKIAALVALTLMVLALAIVVAGLSTLRTEWFKNEVRQRIVGEVEKATGGRVEIGRFHYTPSGYFWSEITADVTPFILHGTEPAGRPPLFRAERVHVRLRVISFLAQKAEIQALDIERPQAHIYVKADGTTNVPAPPNAAPARGNVVADILALRVRRLSMRNGLATYNSEDLPFDVQADDVAADLHYSALPPKYVGNLSAKQLHVSARPVRDAIFAFTTGVVIDKDAIRIQNARLISNRSTLDLSGWITDFASPHATLDLKSNLVLADFVRSIKLPVASQGDVAVTGKATVRFAPFRYAFDGRVNGRDLVYDSSQWRVRSSAVSANVSVTPEEIKLTGIDAAALGGHFRGSAVIQNLNRFRISGIAEGISTAQVAAMHTQAAAELSGNATGPVEAEGVIGQRGFEDVKAKAALQIARGPAGLPVEGAVSLAYDQRSGVLQLGNSNLMIGTSHITATGALGHAVAVHVTSRDLHDLALALPLVDRKLPESIPVKLVRGGTATFDGTITGSLNNAVIAGQLQLTSFEFDNRTFSRLSANFDASRSSLNVRTLAVDGDVGHATASGRLALVNWAPTAHSLVSASINIRGADVAKLIVETGRKYPVSGTISGAFNIAGEYGAPHVTGRLQVDHAIAYEQPFDRITADVDYEGGKLEAIHGTASAGQGVADFSGSYEYSGADWMSGRATFQVASRGFKLAQIQPVATRWKDIAGRVDVQATGLAHFIHGEFELDDLDSRVDVQNLAIAGDSLGDIRLAAKTRGQILDVDADAKIRGAEIRGQGEWRLAGDYPGHAQITVPHIELTTIRDLLPSKSAHDLPFGGFLSASANVSIALKKPETLRADATVSELQINAAPSAQPRAGAQPKDLVLRSAGPLQFDITSKSVTIRNARFVGTDTTIQATGRVGFEDSEPWNLRVNGSVNLAILQLFNPDLLASGASTVNATVRGPLKQPDVNGRLELRKASLYVADLPNGVENANGVIAFDRSRATVERLSGETGGGKITFEAGSFVGFSGPLLIYHVQATADHVRYRSEEGMSITGNASLSLSGTSERSTLSGAVTVTRAAFSPQTDVGSLLASFAKPVSVPSAPSAYVRGIQFDVRIDTAQNLEVLTSLTRDIQAEANLRLRGNVDRPILLGNVSVTEGEIDFFGNKYRINRGELNFNNPAKIEPVVNMDLETRVRGITVDITFAGPLNKLSFSYRSDPPLDSAQIIALLAVGREPVGLGALASSQAMTNSSYLATGTNAILQQAITAPVSGRLQRFFGVSHIKIDPQLTDITSVPQARLTFEQQISKDITLTYITNLSRTSEQVIRVEWDLSRRWSVVAVRDENGLFGMDLQYRKRFK